MFLVEKILVKIQNIIFKVRLWVNAYFGLPAQTSEERKIFCEILSSLRGGKLRVFEWGCGYSTIYYAKLLKCMGVDFIWHAVDNHGGWCVRVREMAKRSRLDDTVTVHLKEFPPFWEKQGWDWKALPPRCGVFTPKLPEEKEYIDLPRTLGEKFDLIFIDARFRRHCLKTAFDMIKNDGVVVMHDAQKPHYHLGTEVFRLKKFYVTGAWYPLQKIPNQMWVGSKSNNNIFELLKKFEA